MSPSARRGVLNGQFLKKIKIKGIPIENIKTKANLLLQKNDSGWGGKGKS